MTLIENNDNNYNAFNPNDDSLSEISVISRTTTGHMKDTFRKDTNQKDLERDHIHEVLFFLGADAAIPAGISGVIGLVDDFREWLQKEGKTDYLVLTNAILDVINKKSRNNVDRNKADIETLLVIT
jgi:hypothetical protein